MTSSLRIKKKIEFAFELQRENNNDKSMKSTVAYIQWNTDLSTEEQSFNKCNF